MEIKLTTNHRTWMFNGQGHGTWKVNGQGYTISQAPLIFFVEWFVNSSPFLRHEYVILQNIF